MKKKYEGNNRVIRPILQSLCKEFENLEMKSGEQVYDYSSRVMTIANKMRVYGMSDIAVVEKILRSLSEKFNYVVCSIDESKDIDNLSIDELQSSLIVHEQKFQRQKGEEQVLKVSHKEKVNGRGRGRNSSRRRGRGRGRGSQLKRVDVEEELVLMAYADDHETKTSDAWFLDTGCSNHMCSDRSVFSSFVDDIIHSLRCGNNTTMQVAGKGNVKLVFNGIQFMSSQVPQKNVCIPDSTSAHLWHQQYGHLNLKGLKTLQSKGMVHGLPQFGNSSITCPDCFLGKQHRNVIPKRSEWCATKLLELVHADICGPIEPTSHGGKRCPTLAVKNVTPQEAWSGIKPSEYCTCPYTKSKKEEIG
ncbi:uncharacterized protein LOC127262758 [Andrographis paniculata]|uniref:uncharacterized protein LOC127262758 n=1 Tax=Andrographis paniculata TaxID=175694 RepID=UPI0021E99657|nr:uncharacterized protein LOC127262758 [Andrographis paniculata]